MNVTVQSYNASETAQKVAALAEDLGIKVRYSGGNIVRLVGKTPLELQALTKRAQDEGIPPPNAFSLVRE